MYLFCFVICHIEGFKYLSILTAPHFDHGTTIGHVNSHTVREESGLCASRRHTNILYTHNDSGDSARFYALDATTAHIKATLNVVGATSHDWEDIACGNSIHQNTNKMSDRESVIVKISAYIGKIKSNTMLFSRSVCIWSQWLVCLYRRHWWKHR